MNDRFKFRAWHNTAKKMIYFSNWHMCEEYLALLFNAEGLEGEELPGAYRGGEKYNYSLGEDWNPENSNNWHLMQCTGLKDKNGKLIYEGDIINENNSKHTTQIVWGEMTNKGDLDMDMYIVGFLKKWSGGGLSPLGYYNGIEGEVIGNLYEHPNLLK